mmetsp:Transcript_44143/g.141501  ORF Transcript_44143/g.141501 Transcript_44143/m.141501 type:complete len:91 (-) Transcript_44143:216-488(-)
MATHLADACIGRHTLEAAWPHARREETYSNGDAVGKCTHGPTYTGFVAAHLKGGPAGRRGTKTPEGTTMAPATRREAECGRLIAEVLQPR